MTGKPQCFFVRDVKYDLGVRFVVVAGVVKECLQSLGLQLSATI